MKPEVFLFRFQNSALLFPTLSEVNPGQDPTLSLKDQF